MELMITIESLFLNIECFFLHSYMNLITISIRVLESNAIHSTEVSEEMLRLRICLNFWMNDRVVFVSKLTRNTKKL